MWYAISHEDKRVIAAAPGMFLCSVLARGAMPWGGNPAGEVAPYFLTTRPAFFRAVFPIHPVKE